VSFDKEEINFSEDDDKAKIMLTLSEPTPCCLNLYVEVKDGTATGM